MARADYDDVAGVLHGLVIRLADKLTGMDRLFITEFIEVGGVGLALEQIADVLSECTATHRSERPALSTVGGMIVQCG